MKNPKQDIMEYMMKTKKKKIITFIALHLLGFFVFYLFFMPKSIPRKPFYDLNMLSVESIEIVSASAGRKIDGVYLLDEDKEKVLSIIRDIKIKGRTDDSDSSDLSFQSIWPEMFCIKTREGETIRIGLNRLTAYYEPIDPIVIIDFIEYNANKKSTKKCEELLNYYESLLNKYELDTRLLYF